MAVSLGFSQFAHRMGDFTIGVGRSSQRVVRKSMEAAVKTIVPGTPVKTGLARGNWVVQSGSPFEGTLLSTDPAGQRTVQAALREIDRYRGGELFLTNNLSYIDELDAGHSAQAPAGFSRQAFAAARREAAAVRLLEGV